MVVALAGCHGATRPPDTRGVQTYGRWEWHGRLRVEPDSHLTLTRMWIDTGGPGSGEDVVLVRYDFNPAPGVGDEYAIALGLRLGDVRALGTGVTYPIGAGGARIPAYATVACLCEPVKLDSARGVLRLATRGLRQLTGRIDVTLYFQGWNVPARHVVYSLHQRFDALK